MDNNTIITQTIILCITAWFSILKQLYDLIQPTSLADCIKMREVLAMSRACCPAIFLLLLSLLFLSFLQVAQDWQLAQTNKNEACTRSLPLSKSRCRCHSGIFVRLLFHYEEQGVIKVEAMRWRDNIRTPRCLEDLLLNRVDSRI